MLTADALMNLSPWDYWEAGGHVPKGATDRILRLIENVLGVRHGSPIAANPLHPGAIHLYIHTVEASAEPERAAPHAARLAALMPAPGISSICQPHLVPPGPCGGRAWRRTAGGRGG